jgi:hypothetical protein
MTNVRWMIEGQKMQKVFPAFEPFIRSGLAGFAGPLKGRGGKVYQVTVQASVNGYPAQVPRIFIQPWAGPNRNLDGSLCVNRRWKPDQDTFAQQVLYAAHYLQLHG